MSEEYPYCHPGWKDFCESQWQDNNLIPTSDNEHLWWKSWEAFEDGWDRGMDE